MLLTENQKSQIDEESDSGCSPPNHQRDEDEYLKALVIPSLAEKGHK